MISGLGDQIVFTQQAGGDSLESNQLQSSLRRPQVAMADLNSSLESRVSADATSTSPAVHSVASSCDTLMWEGWSTQAPSTGDDTSTSSTLHLPELATSNSRHQFHHQSDMLANMLSSFHPLSQQSSGLDPDGHESPGLLQDAVLEADSEVTSFGETLDVTRCEGENSKSVYLTGIPCPSDCGTNTRREDHLSQYFFSKPTSAPLQLWQPLGPEPPGSPLALHGLGQHAQGGQWNGSLPWSGATSSTTIQLLQDASVRENLDKGSHASKKEMVSYHRELHGDQSRAMLSSSLHRDIVLSPHEHLSPGLPPDYSGPTTRSQQFMNFLRISQERPLDSEPALASRLCGDHCHGKLGVKREQARSGNGKHRLQVVGGDEANCCPSAKRATQVDHVAGSWNAHALMRVAAPRSLYPPSASQAMEIFAIGPALNTNGKPRARRGSATDPQSVYARHRREKINERLKTLQHLVPNGSKVDIVTMLDEAVHYVQFLQRQVKLLRSDKYWILATPNTYKGIDLTNPPTHMQGLGPNA